jgi:HEAT repeat protein
MSHLPLSRKIPSSVDVTQGGRRLVAAAVVLLAFAAAAVTVALAAQGAAAPSPALAAHVTNLASLDYPTRMTAARMIRRAPAADAVATLRAAVDRHADEFVRYRAFVILSSFNDPGTGALVRALLKDRNDRLREAAYKWLELNPDPGMASTLLAALQTEQAEFVRPALVGALAALGSSPSVQRALVTETSRGLDFFRGAVIDALGRHRATYAVDAIAGIATLEGPLQDDAVMALGRIGGPRATAALAAMKAASPEVMPTVRAAQCLAGQPCEAAIKLLVDSAGAQGASGASMRAAVNALAALASDGNTAATGALVSLAGRGGGIRDQAAIGLGTAAVRNPGHLISWLDAAPETTRAPATDLLRDGFEDLEEDFGEEQFFAAVRASYWKAPEGSASRTLAASLIEKLQF